ncbi:hypothetical protein PCE1_004932 [Barthelona sp. PCE]
MSNIEIDNTIQKSMNETAKPGGITAPANTEDCEILHVIDISAHVFQSAPVYVAPKPQPIPKRPEREVPMGKREIEVDKVLQTTKGISLLVESGMLNIKYGNQKFQTELFYNSDFQYLVSGRSDGAVICEYSGTSGTLFFFNNRTGTMSFTHCFEFDISDVVPSNDIGEYNLMIDGHDTYCVLCISSEAFNVVVMFNVFSGDLRYEKLESRRTVKNIFVHKDCLAVEYRDGILPIIISGERLLRMKNISVAIPYDEIRPFQKYLVFRAGCKAIICHIQTDMMYEIDEQGCRTVMDPFFLEIDMAQVFSRHGVDFKPKKRVKKKKINFLSINNVDFVKYNESNEKSERSECSEHKEEKITNYRRKKTLNFDDDWVTLTAIFGIIILLFVLFLMMN